MPIPLDNPLYRLMMMTPQMGLAPRQRGGAFRNVGPNNLVDTPDRNAFTPEQLMRYRTQPQLFEEGT